MAGALLRKSANRVHAAAPHCDAASRVRGLNAFQAQRWKAEAHAVVALPTDEPSLIQDWQWSVHAFFPHLDKHERSEFVCLALHCFRGSLSSHRGIHVVEPLTQLLTKARAPVAHPCIPTCGAEASERPRERLQRRRARLWGPFFHPCTTPPLAASRELHSGSARQCVNVSTVFCSLCPRRAATRGAARLPRASAEATRMVFPLGRLSRERFGSRLVNC